MSVNRQTQLWLTDVFVNKQTQLWLTDVFVNKHSHDEWPWDQTYLYVAKQTTVILPLQPMPVNWANEQTDKPQS